jgi:hypothetical protein
MDSITHASPVPAPAGRPNGRRDRTLEANMRFRSMMTAFREWAANRYKPEKHYMRGPGPACAARTRRLGQI